MDDIWLLSLSNTFTLSVNVHSTQRKTRTRMLASFMAMSAMKRRRSFDNEPRNVWWTGGGG
jgi:hypothetical protein